MPRGARSTGSDGSVQTIGFACCLMIGHGNRGRHHRTDKLPSRGKYEGKSSSLRMNPVN
jgi:hypothetical protein